MKDRSIDHGATILPFLHCPALSMTGETYYTRHSSPFYLFLTPNNRSVFCAGVSININSFIHSLPLECYVRVTLTTLTTATVTAKVTACPDSPRTASRISVCVSGRVWASAPGAACCRWGRRWRTSWIQTWTPHAASAGPPGPPRARPFAWRRRTTENLQVKGQDGS